jgi:DNA-directed RNA polymerase specialized sigma24 family protein
MSLFSPPAPASCTAAFDLLHERHAAAIVRQTFLLCGRRRLAERAVARAFRLAWERWPEVATDRDPAAWVRAAAHEYALAPWRRRARRADEGHQGPLREGALLDALLDALLSLPPGYRRSLVLHDAVGLSLADTAAEVEASMAAAAGRIVRARDALAGWLPQVAQAPPAERGAVLRELFGGLTAAQPGGTRTGAGTGTSGGEAVRAASERATRRVTQAALAFVALMMGLIAAAAATPPS